jgi:hypothetical protein
MWHPHEAGVIPPRSGSLLSNRAKLLLASAMRVENVTEPSLLLGPEKVPTLPQLRFFRQPALWKTTEPSPDLTGCESMVRSARDGACRSNP